MSSSGRSRWSRRKRGPQSSMTGAPVPNTSRPAPKCPASHSTPRWVFTVPISSHRFGMAAMSSATARSRR
ncbi:hypothetical protein ACFQQB_10730 [Nonomuraea rubra]|uniref:hypothetical protein n=1 Tax=Nonomuraea rubra TaxID=46180 RepID=UPI00361B59EC